ncbi:SulP family inorganic anion transporter [Humibacillus xanthopallidus]|uniref:High affinity sulfate transporter 1 n=1 Tax=Humibacillus xanthopallidus TaxID=412689 RepID=A0A543HU07_9MICO|nr:SulP family inorganic anion transporter [Humibacillus xanthopallidus]TQM61847.1 high affinity sulfate transporter 1 [Humibacillus xanthopallidus]
MTDRTRTTRRPRWLAPSFGGYRRTWLTGDLLAGLTVWAVLVPESLAYATIAGVSPVVGLYAAVPSLILYPLLGSSRHLVVATMSGTAALSASVVADVASQGGADFAATTAALAVVMGLLCALAGVVRMGFIASFISEPVLKGFIIGLALTIIIGQVPALLGIDKPPGSFFEKLWGILGELRDIDWLTTAVGMASLVVILVLKRYLPLVPASLVVVLTGIAAVALFGLDEQGLDIVGPIDSGLPSLALPDVGLDHYLALVGPAFGVLLIGFAEGLGAAKTYAAKEGYDVDPNAELLGMGAANVGSGLFGGMVVNGSLSKTAVNGGAGAKSQVSGLTVAALTVITLLFLTGLFEDLPEAVLAAVVIAAVIELVDIASLSRLYRVWTGPLGRIYRHTTRVDFIAALAALLGVLVFDTLPGLFIGIGVSVIVLLYRSSRPHVARLVRRPGPGDWVDQDRAPEVPPTTDVVVLRVESGLFFANADHVRDTVLDAVRGDTVAVVLDAETIPTIDVTGAGMLVALRDRLAERGIQLLVAKSIGQVRDVVATAEPGADVPGRYDSIDAAIKAARGVSARPEQQPPPPATPGQDGT